MYSRIINPPTKTSLFLFGPRGVGKTTWIQSTFPHALYFDLLKAETFNFFLANPSRLEHAIPPDHKDWIIIDEIQKVPQLLDEVHRLIENKKLKFILTGSSARKLRRSGVNLLAGRALTFYLHPLTSIELQSDFDLHHALEFGTLPQIFSAENQKHYLHSYVKTYLEQEISQEGIARNLDAFARFLETASFSQGSSLNMSSIARESAIGRKMAQNYFAALEDLLIGVRLPPFSKRAKRKLVASDKFYLFDTGVYRAIRPTGPFDQPEFIGGIALETLFFQNLRAINDYYQLNYNLFYWRTVSGTEVDFVAYGDKGIKAFEIKSKKNISNQDLRGLKTFLLDYPQAKGYIIYGGDIKQYRHNIEIWPATKALQNLPQILQNSTNLHWSHL